MLGRLLAGGWLSPRLGQVDRPGHRKVHAAPMPTSGGLAIWLGIVAPLALGQLLLIALPSGRYLPDFAAPHLPGLLHQRCDSGCRVAAQSLSQHAPVAVPILRTCLSRFEAMCPRLHPRK